MHPGRVHAILLGSAFGNIVENHLFFLQKSSCGDSLRKFGRADKKAAFHSFQDFLNIAFPMIV